VTSYEDRDSPSAFLSCTLHYTRAHTYFPHSSLPFPTYVGEKPHVCRECGRAFAQSANLRTHLKSVHAKERPHECTECGAKFARKR